MVCAQKLHTIMIKQLHTTARRQALASLNPRPDRGASLYLGDPDAPGAKRVCPVCLGTGWKPCGQCEGTGVNQEDKFGGSYKAGDACWLCDGAAKTMCGNCVDLTDEF
eukprot:357270-Chlamydomonas_euryale.AAC.19